MQVVVATPVQANDVGHLARAPGCGGMRVPVVAWRVVLGAGPLTGPLQVLRITHSQHTHALPARSSPRLVVNGRTGAVTHCEPLASAGHS